MFNLRISWEILEEGVGKVKQQLLEMERPAEVDDASVGYDC